MSADFRALCAELLDEVVARPLILDRELIARARAALADEPAVPEGKKPTRDELWELWLRLNNELPDRPAAVAEFWEHAQIDARARAALTKPDEPAVPQGREPAAVTEQPSDQELLDIAASTIEPYECSGITTDEYEPETECAVEAYGSELIAFARAVLAHWGNPAPAPPADGEVAGLVEMLKGIAYWRLHGTDKPTPFDIRQAARLTRAAELLQRQAPQPPADGEVAELVEWLRDHAYVLNPSAERKARRICALLQHQALPGVAVSERLPGPEDRDAEGRCWWFVPASVLPNGTCPYWCLAPAESPRSWFTHWRPANAFPLPEAGE